MSRTGTSILPLHYGHPPEYLYKRMVKLSGLIVDLIVQKFGTEHLLRNMADPFWFHSLSLATGFDWNSSGTTTATLSALKDYYTSKGEGIVILGGKGRHMSGMADEIINAVENGFIKDRQAELIRKNAKELARVDNNLLQDGFDLYLQFVILGDNGRWALIQQGMNSSSRMARRYHWIDDRIENRLNDGRSGIATESRMKFILDLTTSLSDKNRKEMVELTREGVHNYYSRIVMGRQRTLDNFAISEPLLRMDYRIDWKKMRELYEYQPKDFTELYGMERVGKSTIRALSYIAELIYGDAPSFADPVKYSFGLGGKDGVPKPVNVIDYNRIIEFYDELLQGEGEKKRVMENLVRGMARESFNSTGMNHMNGN